MLLLPVPALRQRQSGLTAAQLRKACECQVRALRPEAW